jgi:hypothetical protein
MKRAVSLNFSNFYIFFVAFSTFPMLLFTRSPSFLQGFPEIMIWILIGILAAMKPMLRYERSIVEAFINMLKRNHEHKEI